MRKFIWSLLCLALFSGGASLAQAETKSVVFAGGCFWCMQAVFDEVKGVTKTVVGYTGGEKATAHYDQVSSETTQQREAIEVTYDPQVVSYDRLLDVYWHNINPTQANGQFYDIGPSYHAAIYYSDAKEKAETEASKEKLAKSGRFDKPIVTEILPRTSFYPAEDYHQKYYLKNPAQYDAYHNGSGRTEYEKKVWSEKK